MQPDSPALDLVRDTDRHRRSDADDESVLPGNITEDALAQAFTAAHADTLRYCSALGGWQWYDGIRWQRDETLLAFDRARAICRDTAKRLSVTKREAPRLLSAATVAAVVKLATADRRHATVASQFDSDPWLLTTPGGTVDLRTGRLRDNRATDYSTRCVAVTPGGDAHRFQQFLREVTGFDEMMVAFLHRVIGYLLTGVTREHALFFVHGSGGNGKSVLLNLLLWLLGDYGRNAPMSLFTETKHDGHPTELAMLRGARFVMATETEQGRPWAESRIKAMTGDDPITARFMHRDFFTFTAQFKLAISGNHKPSFRNPDEAIRRRLHLIPFNQRFTAPDRDLPAKLRAEGGGILAWAIEGCLRWQEQGLQPPVAVQLATTNYLESEDSIAAWLSECAMEDPQAWTSSADLFESWSRWAKAGGEDPREKKYLAEQLESRGFIKKRNRAGTQRGFLGIAVAQVDQQSDAFDMSSHLRRSTRARYAQAQQGNAEDPSDVSEPAA